jgi:PhnB protein
MAKAKKAVPEGYHTVTPSLTLDDAPKAIDWYKRALGAEEIARSTSPDGKVMHAELRVGNSRIMMNDAVMGGKGPKELGGSPAGLWLYVDDCDVLFNRAVTAGATVEMPLGDQFWGDRFGSVRDPFGYRWSFATRKEDLTAAETEARAADFYKQMAAMGNKP